jgi:predicted  nucleic acid-binding Zn-ribbon protein
MRKPYLLILLSLMIFFTFRGYSQKTIEVTHTRADMSKGNQAGYVVQVPQASLEDVRKDWKKLLESGTKSKAVGAGAEIDIRKVVNLEISPDTFNIYSILFAKDSTISLTAFFEIDSVFFEPSAKKDDLLNEKTDQSIRNYLRNFSVGEYRKAVEKELKAETKKLDDLEKDLSNLVKDKKNLEKSITKNEENIKQSEDLVKEYDHQSQLKMTEITTHETSMMSITDEAGKKEAKAKLKDLRKEKNKIGKQRANAQKDITGYKSDIEKANKDIYKNMDNQKETQGLIDARQQVVNAVQAKLSGIK